MKDATIVVGIKGKGSTGSISPLFGGQKGTKTIPFGFSYETTDVDNIFFGLVAGVKTS